MDLSSLLKAAGDLFSKLVSGLKSIATVLFIRRATQIEDERNLLKKSSASKSAQLEIAARPADALPAILDGMRNGEL